MKENTWFDEFEGKDAKDLTLPEMQESFCELSVESLSGKPSVKNKVFENLCIRTQILLNLMEQAGTQEEKDLLNDTMGVVSVLYLKKRFCYRMNRMKALLQESAS